MKCFSPLSSPLLSVMILGLSIFPSPTQAQVISPAAESSPSSTGTQGTPSTPDSPSGSGAAPKEGAMPGINLENLTPEQIEALRRQLLAPTQQPMDADESLEIAKKLNRFMVIIEGDKGRGTGFLAKYKDENVLLTNAHVLSGNQTFLAKSLQSTNIGLSGMNVAKTYDVAKLQLRESTEGLPIMENVDQEVSIGDVVMVPGNSLGEGVVTRITGKVVGVGPQVIEVDAKFVSGNSGSPVIHVKTGKVIGIATYSVIRAMGAAGRDSQFNQLERRFAYRLDNVPGWEQIHWNSFKNEAVLLEKFNERARLLIDFNRYIVARANAERQRQQPVRVDVYGRAMNPPAPMPTFNLAAYQEASNPLLIQSIRSFIEKLSRPRMAQSYYADETRKFVRSVTNEIDRDVQLKMYQGFSDYHRVKITEAVKRLTELKAHFLAIDSELR